MKVLVFTVDLAFMGLGSSAIGIPSLVYVIQTLQLVGGEFLQIHIRSSGPRSWTIF
jgi:hypothetical protein